MTYAAVDTIQQAARTGGDIKGKINAAMIKYAGGTRLPVVTAANYAGDLHELTVCRSIISGTYPTSWTTAVLILLDIAGQLGDGSATTDAQIDAKVVTAWQYFILTSS